MKNTSENILTKSLSWWNSLPDNTIDKRKSKFKLADKYYQKHWMGLTYIEIDNIWKRETGGDFSHISDELIFTDDDMDIINIHNKHNS